MNPSVVYLQKRTHRAGAQTCLARLLRHPGMRRWNPVVVCSAAGWLTEECERQGIPVVIEPFPSSRSLGARLLGNRQFAKRVQVQLAAQGRSVQIVHANDHLEGLLGLELARAVSAKRAIFLRSPGMVREDLFKYGCLEYDLIATVGEELQARNLAWAPTARIELIHDGVYESEFAPVKPKPPVFPARVLVIGSPLDWKGWADLTEALHQLQSTGKLPAVEFDFTGAKPDPALNNLHLERLPAERFHFLGRVEQFRELVRQYDLVINPTRMESFGMAAVEVLAAGVPLLTSRTGIIEQVQEDQRFLFAPRGATELAERLGHLLTEWPQLEIDVARCQANIRQRFMVDHAVEKLSAGYERILRA